MKKFNYSNNFYLDQKIKFPSELIDLKKHTKNQYVTIGNLRSYNDAAIGHNPISLKKFKEILEVNNDYIEVESGATINDILKKLIEEKKFIYGLPGTKYATVGGILANNTLGKSILNPYLKHSVLSFKLLNNGKIIECDENNNNQIFNLTLGGKGITGIIISAKIKVYDIENEDLNIKKTFFRSSIELRNILKKNNIKDLDYIAAWVDTTKKDFPGILFKATHVKGNRTKYRQQEFNLPRSVIYLMKLISSSIFFVKLFNTLFFFKNKFSQNDLKHYLDFYFVQDSIFNWNMIFKKGFFQYQIEIDADQFEDIVKKLQEIFNLENIYSQFMVIKFIYSNEKLSKIIISFDFTINKNFEKIKDILLEFTKRENLKISLSKDSMCDEKYITSINNTLISDGYYKKFHCKNFSSNLLQRLKIK